MYGFQETFWKVMEVLNPLIFQAHKINENKTAGVQTAIYS